VISHDDRYYHLGDRIVKLDYGTLTAEVNNVTGATIQNCPHIAIRR
jgi:ABC-type siderophore export system fused ATPase/permease subunit